MSRGFSSKEELIEWMRRNWPPKRELVIGGPDCVCHGHGRARRRPIRVIVDRDPGDEDEAAAKQL